MTYDRRDNRIFLTIAGSLAGGLAMIVATTIFRFPPAVFVIGFSVILRVLMTELPFYRKLRTLQLVEEALTVVEDEETITYSQISEIKQNLGYFYVLSAKRIIHVPDHAEGRAFIAELGQRRICRFRPTPRSSAGAETTAASNHFLLTRLALAIAYGSHPVSTRSLET